MGKGQEVSVWYMGIRAGEPQPMTAIKVGVWRWRRVEGEMDFASVRRYS